MTDKFFDGRLQTDAPKYGPGLQKTPKHIQKYTPVHLPISQSKRSTLPILMLNIIHESCKCEFSSLSGSYRLEIEPKVHLSCKLSIHYTTNRFKRIAQYKFQIKMECLEFYFLMTWTRRESSLWFWEINQIQLELHLCKGIGSNFVPAMT